MYPWSIRPEEQRHIQRHPETLLGLPLPLALIYGKQDATFNAIGLAQHHDRWTNENKVAAAWAAMRRLRCFSLPIGVMLDRFFRSLGRVTCWAGPLGHCFYEESYVRFRVVQT